MLYITYFYTSPCIHLVFSTWKILFTLLLINSSLRWPKQLIWFFQLATSGLGNFHFGFQAFKNFIRKV